MSFRCKLQYCIRCPELKSSQITDYCQSSWSTHVSAAADLLGIWGSRVPKSLVSFASKFFATRDVMGRSGCKNKYKFQETSWGDHKEVTDPNPISESVYILVNIFQIDKSSGCSFELINIIASTTHLSQKVVEVDNGQSNNQELLFQQINSLENQLKNLTQTIPTSITSAEASMLTQTSTLTYNAAKIYFYTTVRHLSPSAQIIRSLVSSQIPLISKLSSFSPAHLWSIFVTAFYAPPDDELRIFFLDQFEKFEALPATRSSTENAKRILKMVWKKRDLESDLKLERLTIHDWARFVRPPKAVLGLV
jgi:hypothetical protein